jgi:16S rRNA (cytosine967-C5)-methyltransferase
VAVAGGGRHSLSLKADGSIAAWDIHPHRVELTEKTLMRLQVQNATAAVNDASVWDASFFEKMDAVLVDAPCSGLGLWGKPDAKMNKDEEAVKRLAVLQKSILTTCSNYVKPNGVLVYSTCTVSYAENHAQIEALLKEHTEFSIASLAPYVPKHLRERVEGGMLQIFPHLDGAEGFFVARMVKHG